jgi:hypothetical protein
VAAELFKISDPVVKTDGREPGPLREVPQLKDDGASQRFGNWLLFSEGAATSCTSYSRDKSISGGTSVSRVLLPVPQWRFD